MDNTTTTISLIPEEPYDKESMPLTASSSLTLRTTSDDEIANAEPLSLPPIEFQTKVFLLFLLFLLVLIEICFLRRLFFHKKHRFQQ